MSNKIEKFIGDNREDFDDKIPSAKTWDNIEAAFCEKKKKKFMQAPVVKWSMAAAATLLISVSIYWFVSKNKKTQHEIAVVETPVDTTMQTDVPEVNEFAKMIAVKQEELKVIAKEQPELYQRFTSDMNQLDSSYILLKKQFRVSPNREVLVEAMIQNLQLQLNVLNQQLNVIHQIKQSKKNSHEKNNQII
ncbi:MAG: hypothetical protein ABJA78_03970 [Ferruginibacter sp.]